MRHMNGNATVIKIDNGNRPPKKSRIKYPFDKMKPGQSFHYKGSRNTAIIAFGYHLAKGKYETIKEGDGYRFILKETDEKEV